MKSRRVGWCVLVWRSTHWSIDASNSFFTDHKLALKFARELRDIYAKTKTVRAISTLEVQVNDA
jgi:hypothetical protein